MHLEFHFSFYVETQFTQLSDAALRAGVMNEDAACAFPNVPMLEKVIDENISRRDHMAKLVPRRAGDQAVVGEVLRIPALLLRRSPCSARNAGKENRIQMSARIIEVHRTFHQVHRTEEVRVLFQLIPERGFSVDIFIFMGRHAKNLVGEFIEIGEDPIGVEEKLSGINHASDVARPCGKLKIKI